VAAAIAAAGVGLILRAVSTVFLPTAQPVPSPDASASIISARRAASIASATLAAAAPAFAEEAAKEAEAGGFLNFGKIELGGGFAINLDIPETGIVNIVVLIGGLLYLLGPLLSNSMDSREKEIQQDIDDAIAKYNEAVERLAEAEKAKAQADTVTAEIEASIAKDQQEFKATIEANTKAQLDRAAAASDAGLASLSSGADTKVSAYISQQAVERGMKELMKLSDAQKDKFMEQAIASL
jgi:F-type H+-transporting ATPase subunit b